MTASNIDTPIWEIASDMSRDGADSNVMIMIVGHMCRSLLCSSSGGVSAYLNN